MSICSDCESTCSLLLSRVLNSTEIYMDPLDQPRLADCDHGCECISRPRAANNIVLLLFAVTGSSFGLVNILASIS